MRAGNFLKNSLLVMAGLAAAWLLLEAALRLYHPLEIRFKPDRIVLPVNKRYVFDNCKKFPHKLPRTTVHTKNFLGFRGAPPPKDFADYLTIVTIGGSTTECFYLSDGKTWTDVLGRLLSGDFRRLWVNNAGLDGATTYRHLLLLEDYLVKLRPKVAIFLVGINDVGAGDLEESNRKKSSALKNLSNRVMNHSEVYSLGQNLYRYLVARDRGLHHREIDLKSQETLDRVAAGVREETLSKLHQESLPYYRQRLEKLIVTGRGHGIEPVFLTQPVLYGKGTDPATAVDLATVKLGENLNGALMLEVVELYNEALRQVARRSGAPLIDLAAKMPRDSALYYDYLHYTEAGAVAVAEIVHRELRPLLALKYPEMVRAGGVGNKGQED
jgi:lysophospholipase L1-like esterase